MKAIINDNYGSPDVLKYEEIQMPVPGDDELLIKVHAASLNAADWHLLRADPFFVRLMAGGKKIAILPVQPNTEDLVYITELIEAGKITPVIDRSYPLSEVPDALRYLGEGGALGKIVITVEHSDKS